MPGLGTNAPYDTLDVVTQQVRVALGDFIQNLNPNLAGTVSTNGTIVTVTAGSPFSFLLTNQSITINNIVYTVASVSSFTQLVLTASAGVQAGVTYSAVISLGDIFADSQPYVLPTVNLAWRKIQKKLADKGHPRLRNEIDLLSIPVITNLDPISQQFITWTQFFDGTNFVPANLNPPLLPQDLIYPMHIWERPSGMTVEFRPMHPAGNSLRSWNKTSWNRFWDFREDALYMPGSLLNMDWRISYAAFLPDLVVVGTPFSAVPVPIMRCADALAWYSAAIFVSPRGGEALVPGFEARGDQAIDQITNAWAKLQQRSSFHRRAWGQRGRRNLFSNNAY